MRLVRLGQQPSRVAEDIRASLASLGRGITVVGGVALVGVRPSTVVPQIGSMDAIVLQPRGVLLVLGVDLPDPAMKLEAPLNGPWKADGWALPAPDKAVNPATPKLELAERITRHLRPKVPSALPIGTVLAVGPFVDEVDQPAADVAGPVRVLHPTAKHMLAASVSLASAAEPCSVDDVRALLKMLAPEAPSLSDEVLKAEGFGANSVTVLGTEKMAHPEKTDKMPSPEKPNRTGGTGTTPGTPVATPTVTGNAAAEAAEAAPAAPTGATNSAAPAAAANSVAAANSATAAPAANSAAASKSAGPAGAATNAAPPASAPSVVVPPVQQQAPSRPQITPAPPPPAPAPPPQTLTPQSPAPQALPSPKTGTPVYPVQQKPLPPNPSAPRPGPNAAVPMRPTPLEVTTPVPRVRDAAPPRADKPPSVKWLPYGALGLLGVLLVLAIVLAATTGGTGEQPAQAQNVNGISLVQRAAATDTQCAAHAVGDLQADLQRTGCVNMRRASFQTTVDGKDVAVSVAVVTFADTAAATSFKRTADTPGGGSIPDLALETNKWPRAPHFDGTAAYFSGAAGPSVRLVLACYFDQPSRADDPGLVHAAEAGLTARMP